MHEGSVISGNQAKPYPRHCPECGRTTLVAATINYPAEVKHDGRVHCFTVAELPIDQCSECSTEYFTNRTDEYLTAALRRHLGLLQPQEIREGVAALGLTQRSFADQLGIAAETVSRWMNGMTVQTRSLDNLMRAYFAFPQVRAALETKDWENSFGILPSAPFTQAQS